MKLGEFISENRVKPEPECPSCGDVPSIGVVMAAHNEHADDELPGTLRSIRECGDRIAQCVVVDDMSDPPLDGATVRNLVRMGCSRARHIGCAEIVQEITFVIDPHMTFEPGDFEQVACVARATRGLAYAGCRGGTREKPSDSHGCAELVVDRNGLLDVQWRGQPGKGPKRTTGFMGAFYAIPTAVLKSVGGWIGLPGYMGSDELAMSILLTKHEIPITCVGGVAPWHKFRQCPGQNMNLPDIPYDLPGDMQVIRLAATFRLLFEDAAWTRWRVTLAAAGVPERILADAETPEMLAYGARLRARCKLDDAQFFSKGFADAH